MKGPLGSLVYLFEILLKNQLGFSESKFVHKCYSLSDIGLQISASTEFLGKRTVAGAVHGPSGRLTIHYLRLKYACQHGQIEKSLGKYFQSIQIISIP